MQVAGLGVPSRWLLRTVSPHWPLKLLALLPRPLEGLEWWTDCPVLGG